MSTVNDVPIATVLSYDVGSMKHAGETVPSQRLPLLGITAIVAALLACGGGASQTTRTTTPSGPQTCSSDYGCPAGQRCAKDSLQMQGVCAQTVTQYGTPTYSQPDPNSTGPGKGECSFNTDCPIGFKCVKNSGGLRGNCMK